MLTGCQKNIKTGRQTDRQTDRKTERLFSLVIKTKVVQNVNRMSESQSDRQEDIQFARQTDKVTERQNDSMADSRAAKEPALVFFKFANKFLCPHASTLCRPPVRQPFPTWCFIFIVSTVIVAALFQMKV